MIDAPRGPADVAAVFAQRYTAYNAEHAVIDELSRVIDHGTIPERFDDFFHDEMPRHIVNDTRKAHNELVDLMAKVFKIHVPPHRESAPAKKAAEKAEQICYSYNDHGWRRGGRRMKAFMRDLSYWRVISESVSRVVFDYEAKSPYFKVEDPRTHYPPVGWTPWGGTQLDNTMLAYQTTVGELKRRFPKKESELQTAYSKRHSAMSGPMRSEDVDNMPAIVSEFLGTEAWYITTVDSDRVVVLSGSENGDKDFAGVCPIVVMSDYAANSWKHRSYLADNTSLMVAVSRMLSQWIDYGDQMMYGEIISTKLVGGEMRYGPKAYNEFDTSDGVPPRVEKLAPSSAPQFERAMAFVMQVNQMMNRNPLSGADAGDAVSQKALAEIRSPQTQMIQANYWTSYEDGLPKMYHAAMKGMQNIYGTESIEVPGGLKYRPVGDTDGYEHCVEVKPGIGLAGFAGKQELMLLEGQKHISKETAREENPDILEPQEEGRRVQREQVEEVMWADLAAKAANGIIDVTVLADLHSDIESGTDLFEALKKRGAQLTPPPPTAPEPGAPPGLEQILGGGGIPPQAGPPPSLAEITGSAA